MEEGDGAERFVNLKQQIPCIKEKKETYWTAIRTPIDID